MTNDLVSTLREHRDFKRKVARLPVMDKPGRRLTWTSQRWRMQAIQVWQEQVIRARVSRMAIELAWLLSLRHHSESGGCWMTRAELARILQVHPKSLEAAVRELKREGLIVVSKEPLPEGTRRGFTQTFLAVPIDPDRKDCPSPGGNECPSPHRKDCPSPCILEGIIEKDLRVPFLRGQSSTPASLRAFEKEGPEPENEELYGDEDLPF